MDTFGIDSEIVVSVLTGLGAIFLLALKSLIYKKVNSVGAFANKGLIETKEAINITKGDLLEVIRDLHDRIEALEEDKGKREQKILELLEG